MNKKYLLPRLGIASLLLVSTLTGRAHAGTSIESIRVASTVPAAQSAQIASDLGFLRSYPLTQYDPPLLALMGIKDAATPTLLAWLEERVHYLVPEDYPLDGTTLDIVKQTYAYPEPGILPVLENPTQSVDGVTPNPNVAADSHVVVVMVMANLSAAFYYDGKRARSLVATKIPGVGRVQVTSPRVGILKVGSGLLTTQFPGFTLDPKSVSAWAFRTAILFHEARHSDGHGPTMGFLHAICPSGDYAGYSACDRNLNGPYSIQASYTRTISDSCAGCTSSDQQILRTLILDADSRVIRTTQSAPVAPVVGSETSLTQTMVDACNSLAGLKLDASLPECKDLPALKKKLAGLKSGKSAPQDAGIASTRWDPTPEGQFKP
jgi:hypothetical protein